MSDFIPTVVCLKKRATCKYCGKISKIWQDTYTKKTGCRACLGYQSLKHSYHYNPKKKPDNILKLFTIAREMLRDRAN